MSGKTGISLFGKFGAICIVIAGIYLVYLSYQPVIDLLSGEEFEQREVIINLTIILLGVATLCGGINLVRKTIALEQLIDVGFENGIYTRLEPILKEIAGTQVMIDKIEERMNSMNTNIDRLGKRSVTLTIQGDGSAYGIDIASEVSRFLRLVLLINATLAVFLFLLSFTRAYTPYLITMLYIVWWLEITYDYNLWQRSSAWVWAFIPILTIPITTILFEVVYGGGTLIGSMTLGLVVYATAYFTWSKYIIEGCLPFDLNKLTNKIPKENKGIAHLTILKEKFTRKRHSISTSLIISSLVFGLLLVLQMINIKYNLKWMPAYSPDYLVLTGILLVASYIVGSKLRRGKR
ncbi:MAG: hypothetical protein AEth_01371 [Candidatus Argoarchaeum ethanivorans]|uniref:Uncharacterized protein n=1 Tax=Candidatus Argoarchaeum ethanivorans TaxID=2608793 RepID=A0A8B3S0E0_9EURY|nr:MAG: hypothetical protein AEth_01371 [Candidatus Argoarchaeum ethanivorans]